MLLGVHIGRDISKTLMLNSCSNILEFCSSIKHYLVLLKYLLGNLYPHFLALGICLLLLAVNQENRKKKFDSQ